MGKSRDINFLKGNFSNFGETNSDIRKPSHNCRIMSQDMWWGAIGSSFTVFIGGMLFILLYRGLRTACDLLSGFTHGHKTKWARRKRQSHEITITGKHKISNVVLEKRVQGLTPEEIARLNATETSKIRDVDLMHAVQEWAQRMISAQSLIGQGLVSNKNEKFHLRHLDLKSDFKQGSVMMVFLLSFGSLFIYFVTSIESNESTKVVLSTLQMVDLCFNAFFLFYFGMRLAVTGRLWPEDYLFVIYPQQFIAAQDKFQFWFELNSVVDFFTIPPVIVALYFRKDCIGLRFMRSLRLLQLPEILQYLRILKRNSKIKLASLLSVFLGTWFTAAGFIHIIENSGDPWLTEPNEQSLTYWQCVYLLMVTMSTVGYGDLIVKTTVGQVFMVFFIILGLALFASHVPEIIEIIGSHRKYTGKYSHFTGKKYVIVCGHITRNSIHDFLKDFTRKEKEESLTDIVVMENFNPGLELQALFKRHTTQMKFFQGSVLSPSDLDRIRPDNADACLILADKNCLNPEAEDSANIMRAIAVKQYCPEIRVIAQVLQYHSKAYLQNIPSWDMKKRDSVICLSELKMGFIAQNCIVPGFSTLLANLFVKNTQVVHKTGNWLEIYKEGLSQEIYTEFLSDSFVGMPFNSVCEVCYVRLKLLLIAIQYRTSSDNISILINPDPSILIQEHTLGFFIAKKRTLVQRANIYCIECHQDIVDPRRIKKCGCKRTYDNEKLHYSVIRSQSLGVLPRQGASLEKIETMLNREKVKLDSTGMFHWCPPKGINQVTLNRAMATRLQLSRHVIVCIFGEAQYPGIGLRNFVMPLRASSFAYDELKAIVFVGSLDYINQEWPTISNFPKIFILPGSPLCRADLKAVGISSCDMTVIISSNRTNLQEKTLEDKECILATLNLKAMLFEESMDISDMLLESAAGNDHPSADISTVENKHYYRIPVITALVHDSNVHFLDQEDRDDPDTDLYLTQPYASGCVFASNILNSLMCTTYFNDNILMLIRTLVTGGGTPELEEQLADEDSLRGSIHAQDKVQQRNRCKLARITLCDERFAEFADGGRYMDLFCKALNVYGILCFGIFRLQDPEKQSKKRFVITNPSPLFELNMTDFIMCTVPFHDTQTMATSTYCHRNYSSKFIPLHTLTRKHSIRFTKVPKDGHESESENRLVKDEEKPIEDRHILGTDRVFEDNSASKNRLKTLERAVIDQWKHFKRTTELHMHPKDKTKSVNMTATEQAKAVSESSETSLVRMFEVPPKPDKVTTTGSFERGSIHEEIVTGQLEITKPNSENKSRQSKEDQKSGEEAVFDHSKEELKSAEEAIAEESREDQRSGETAPE
ncbi:calcium-activated potassium channel subunit alpha-1-like [Chiloscyllium plagiosum]|uniref:calcium-activated potassium channel subunit alpha-1-like n=1 Tax=Chiloscyllium plagiosum TaxID=36176 RepID=UPI001CB84F1D|nr:calcium-activated potassium channel subunit alpha-1-like [Chiloscyllium plagiosum]